MIVAGGPRCYFHPKKPHLKTLDAEERAANADFEDDRRKKRRSRRGENLSFEDPALAASLQYGRR